MHRIMLSLTLEQYTALTSLMASDLAKPAAKSDYVARLISEETKRRADVLTSARK